MTDNVTKPQVILGDGNNERRQLVQEVLTNEFDAGVHTADSFDNIIRLLQDHTKGPWNAIIFSDSLRRNHETDAFIPQDKNRATSPKDYASSLMWRVKTAAMYCLYSQTDPECFNTRTDPLDGRPDGVLIKLNPRWQLAKRRQVLISGFVRDGRFRRIRHPPELTFDKSDFTLVEQIRKLSPDRELEVGREILQHLAGRAIKCDRVEIKKMSQGLSGATVFLVVSQKGRTSQLEHVLKLAPRENEWKLKAEVKGQSHSKQTLGIAGATQYIPDLKKPEISDQEKHPELKYAVGYGNWLALCYDFRGGRDFGRTMALESALTASPQDLSKRLAKSYLGPLNAADPEAVAETRLRIMNIVLDCLGKHWYLKTEHISREKRKVWLTTERKGKRYYTLPPYALTDQIKQMIVGFLDGEGKALGTRLLGKTAWDRDRNAIWALLNLPYGTPTGLADLDQELPVILSPCHGDLNSNNALIWLEQSDFPFLIDFPAFQLHGHAIQDLARLEMEVKFTLMDRQEVGPPAAPPAYDHTYSQLDIWKELDLHVLEKPLPGCPKKWRNNAPSVNVDLTLKLLCAIRSKAVEIQKQPLGHKRVPEFFEEYLPALLFFTFQAIAYPGQTIFKRLLAVHSVGRMLEKLARLKS